MKPHSRLPFPLGEACFCEASGQKYKLIMNNDHTFIEKMRGDKFISISYPRKILSADRQTYKKQSKRINRHLRQIGEMALLPIPLTMYVARHS